MDIAMLDCEIQCTPICSGLSARDDSLTKATRFREWAAEGWQRQQRAVSKDFRTFVYAVVRVLERLVVHNAFTIWVHSKVNTTGTAVFSHSLSAGPRRLAALWGRRKDHCA